MKECWLCGRNGNGDRLEVHHIFGGSRRPLSDMYGLTVCLCGNRCHRMGMYSVHRNAKTMQLLHEYGQRKATQEQGWSVDEFVKVFGKNYLEEFINE